MSTVLRECKSGYGLLCLYLLVTALPAMAQQDPLESKFVRNNESGSRINRGEDELEVLVEAGIPLNLTVKGITLNSCQAEVSLDYQQRNTIARVLTKIENKSCASALGEYQIQFNIRDDQGVSSRLDIDETWAQEQGAIIEFTRDYPIGDNVDLQRVKTRNVKCTCAEHLDAEE